VLPFQDAAPTPAGDWRHIVRFGRNVASYKFALGEALLERAARQQTFVPLPELAVPYAAALCEHLQVEDRQSTSAQSQFLDACRSRNRGDLEAAQLAEATVRLGFANVIDAFHVSRGVRDALSGYQDGHCAYCHTRVHRHRNQPGGRRSRAPVGADDPGMARR